MCERNREMRTGTGHAIAAAVALCAVGAALARPVMIKNEDNEHIFTDPMRVPISEKGLVEYVDFMTKGDGLLIDGTGGIAECWTNDQDGEGCVGETCMIAFQFLFYDRLLRLGQGDAAQLGYFQR